MSSIRERLGLINTSNSNIRTRLGLTDDKTSNYGEYTLKELEKDFKNKKRKMLNTKNTRKNEITKIAQDEMKSNGLNASSLSSFLDAKKEYNTFSINSFKTNELNRNTPENIYNTAYNTAMKSDNIKNLDKEIKKQESDTGWAEYEYNKKYIEEDDVDLYDKTIGRAVNGAISLFSPIKQGYKTYDEDGNRVYLPTKQDIKSEKVSGSYETGVGKFLGDTVEQLSRIVSSTLLNGVAPGAGTTAYWGSMFSNSYKGSLIEGNDNTSSLIYATATTALEYLTGKALGSATKGLTGGKTNEYNMFLKDLSKKISKNNTIQNFLANAGSEGTEEFVQEFADRFLKNVILKENNKVLSKETLKDALYSAAIGSITGGILGGKVEDNRVINNQNGLNNSINSSSSITSDSNMNENMQNSINTNINENTTQNGLNTLVTNENNIVNNQDNINEINRTMELLNNKLENETLSYNEKVNLHNEINELQRQLKVYKNKYSSNEDNSNYQNEESDRLLKKLNSEKITQEITNNTELTLKEQQNNIIQNSNPMKDDYHTGIRSVEDIKTFAETLNDNDYKEYFEVGEDFDETYTAKMAKKALETGKITIYSSNPIEQGTFVSPSRMKAESYSSNGKVYSKEVNLTDVAWIDPTQGRYAKVSFKIAPVVELNNVNNTNTVLVPVDNSLSNNINQNNTKNNLNYSSNTSLSFAEQLDSWVQGKWNNRSQLVLFKYTPQLYLELGLKDNPITVSSSKLDRIVNATGKQSGTYHNLGIETAKQLPNAIANPLNILESSTVNDSIVVVTELSDKEGRIVIVSMAIDGKGHIEVTDINNNKEIKRLNSNVMTSAYGRNNYEVWMKNNKDRIIYDKDDGIIKKRINGEWLQLPKGINPFVENNIPQSNNNVKSSIPSSKNINMQNSENNTKIPSSKVLNPIEISKLTKKDANTTPILPAKKSTNKVNDGDSHFAKNIEEKVNMLNTDQKAKILSNDDVKYYDKVTNKESLEKAFKRLNDGGKAEVTRWFNNNENIDSSDVAEGYILLKQYSDKAENAINLAEKDYYNEMVVETAKKMRKLGTTAGQIVQAFNIMERMTPEGMVKYAQSELSEAYDRMIKNKSKEWIDKHREDFDLKPDEVQFIMDTMKEVSKMEDGYDKRVKLAEIQKLMTDKLPPEKGAGIRSWMRISMLFNLKTQVRNVAGNALIMPVNSFSDLFSSYADKIISKKTGVRTTGNTNIKAMLKGMKKGAYEATNDYKKGINTKDMEGNRFEITDGKSFDDKKLIGRTLNRTESLLNYVMDVGDRVFSEAAFENSLQNQMVLNNTTEITQEMIDIAHQEALSRTWNDNNNYTRFVLGARAGINKLASFKGYGLGDVLISFAKTPANLTKAIVDYSPAGLVNTINKGINLKKSLTNGQFTATMQHEFVQSLGKATAGTILYILGIALAKSGITSGKSDDDKDTANFLKNTLGISSYSIKIGNKSFTYDWAQPLAAPLSITANVVNSKNRSSKALLEGIIGSLDTAGSILLEQSFLSSINDVLSDNDGVVSGIVNEVLELPARAVPTFSKQIADLVDGTQRTSFEYNKPIKSAINSIKAKIPFLSKTLNPSVDTMGREIQRYGGKNNIFNVFLNPANVSTENVSKSAEEIYRLYKETGETNVMPRVAPYYINQNNEKVMMTGKDRVKYQRVSGKIIEDNVKKLLNDKTYLNMSDEEKAEVIKNIVDYSYNIAKKEVLKMELSKEYQKAYDYSKIGDIGDYYTFKGSIDDTNKETKRTSITNYLIDSNLNDEQLSFLYNCYYSSDETINNVLKVNIPMKEFIKYNLQTFESDYRNGKAITNSRKNKIIKYVNSLNLSIPQKAILIKMEYSSYTKYDSQIKNYIQTNDNLNMSEKKEILEDLGFKVYTKNGRTYVK